VKIHQKLNIGGMLIAVIPSLIVTILITYASTQAGKTILEETVTKSLTASSEAKKAEIGAYIESIKNQMVSFANDEMYIDAIKNLNEGYEQLPDADDSMRSALHSYYQQDFLTEYKKRNFGKSTNVDDLFARLDNRAIYLQYNYIKNNASPLGSKLLLDVAEDGSLYSQQHQKYHPHIRTALEAFGFYDIFLVNSDSGNIIYTVFKELDFSTNLKKGAYANTELGKAFAKANTLSSSKEVALTDFAPYTPSYEDAAAFIAAPIIDKGKKLGVLIVQMPIDRINNIMTSNKNWSEVGMGATGQSLLVGSDTLLRNQTRTLIEDKPSYIASLKKAGLPAELINLIEVKNSGIGLQPLKNPAVDAALKGQTGIEFFEDYRGEKVIAAYTPFNTLGLNWALLSLIDQDEAFAGITRLKGSIAKSSATVLIVTLMLAGFISMIYARRLVRPIQEAAERMRDINEGEGDLTKRLAVVGDDEIADLSRNFNGFLGKVQKTVQVLATNLDTLKTTASNMQVASTSSSRLVGDQKKETDHIAKSITEMVQRVQEVVSSAETVSSASKSSSYETEQAKGIFKNTLDEIAHMTQKIESTSQVINQLEGATRKIGSVLDVIRGIAEQTNLLALNAAIEAARAGEQGRGFAVVADEVRLLASRTQESTQEIEVMISRLQSEAAEAVKVMGESRDGAQASILEGQKAGEAISNVAEASEKIRQMMLQVTTATEDQQHVSKSIDTSVGNITRLSNQVSSEFESMNRSVEELNALANQLHQAARQFKI
jgi:methyl-accepting chemotaxis protein